VGDRVDVARATTALGVTFNNMSQPIAAAKLMEEAFAEASDLESEPDVVRLLTELARAYANGQDPRALATADRAVAAAERLELTPTIAEALMNRGLALAYAGRLQEPIALLRGVLALAETHGLGQTRLRALNNLAAALSSEDLRATYEINGEIIELARRLGIRSWLGNALQAKVGLAMWVGEWGEADRMIAEIDPTELPAPLAVAFAESVAILQAFRGEIEEADRTLAGVAPLRAAIDDPRVANWQHLTESQVDLLACRLDEAYAAGLASAALGMEGSVYGAEQAVRAALWMGDAKRARKALELHLASPERGRMLAADRLCLAAGVRALEGDVGAALRDFRAAVEAYRNLDLPVSLAFCLLSFGILLGPDVPEARAAADEARDIFTRLGSPTLLARLDDGLARWSGSTTAPRDALVRSASQK
jgi:tetratricopeptide (TPR) repeat protein